MVHLVTCAYNIIKLLAIAYDQSYLAVYAGIAYILHCKDDYIVIMLCV